VRVAVDEFVIRLIGDWHAAMSAGPSFLAAMWQDGEYGAGEQFSEVGQTS
jgi:hypothetical protein